MIRKSTAVAALVDIDLFERIRRLREDFQQLTDAIGQSYVGVNPAAAESEIGETIVWARRGQRARVRLRLCRLLGIEV